MSDVKGGAQEWAILLEIHFTSSFSDILNR